MSDIDSFSIELFEQSKRFLEKAKLENNQEGKKSYLNASLLLGVSALEAHVNAIASEYIETWNNLNILEKSLLMEKEFFLDDGEFILSNNLKMYRLIERIEFIFKKFATGKVLNKSSPWWSKLKIALKKRNELIHPKEKFIISEKIVEDGLDGILGLLDCLYKALYNSPYPAVGRKLDSKLTF